MREEGPVTPVVLPHGSRAWLVTRYADVRAALADPRLYKDWARQAAPRRTGSPDAVTGYLSVHLLNADPPDHTRLRKLVAKAFTARRVAGLRPRVEAITASLLDAMDARLARARPTVDLIEAFAFPLPVTVICELLGVPASRPGQVPGVVARDRGERRRARGVPRARRRRCSTTSPSWWRPSGRPGRRHGVRAGRRARREDSLNERELIAMLFLLLVAGHETTTNLIASGTLALLTNPAELERLRADPALLPGAVEELLRYVNPLNHATDRFTLEPVEIGGVTIPAREWVLCVTSSANHDPVRFPEPGGSTWPATRAATWPSATGSTTASARRWPGWRARSRSARCCRGSPRCRWRPRRTHCAGGPAPSSTAWRPSRCA